MSRETLKYLLILAFLFCICIGVIACQGRTAQTGNETPTPTLAGTSIPVVARTIQAEVELTAAWVGTLEGEQTAQPAPLQTATPLPSSITEETTAKTLTDLKGACVVPDGFLLHQRQGYCLAAPADWISENVDGGIAASLNTTPGQVLALEPGWVNQSSECQLLLYVTTGDSLEDHLQSRYDAFSGRSDLVNLSPLQMLQLGEMAIPGFTWEDSNAAAGGIYADLVDLNRLMHISYQGTNCPLEEILPALETLRFN